MNCGNGPKSPNLFSCGVSKLGQTATGILQDYVVNFTRVSFEISEYNPDFKLKNFFNGRHSSSFVYGDSIHTINGGAMTYGFFPVVGTNIEGRYRVPMPYSPFFEQQANSSKISKAVIDHFSAGKSKFVFFVQNFMF